MVSAAEYLRIILASEFKAKGFSEADKAISKLSKGVKKLGVAFGATLSTRAVVKYAKDSVRAFAADEKAAAILAGTLKNLSLAYETKPVEDFIKSLETQYHVADDLLRPAFQALVQQTHSVTASQKLLQSALDISAGSGQDLSTVVFDLNQAWVGNVKGLRKYNIGLTAAEMKTRSFEEILSALTKNYRGAATTAANTYRGKVDALNIAFGNMQETVGKGIIDALGTLAADRSIDTVIAKVDLLALALADTVRGIGNVGRAIETNMPFLKGASAETFIQAIPILGSYWAAAIQSGRNSRINAMGANPEGGIGGSQSSQEIMSAKAARDKAKQDAIALKRQKELEKLLKQQNKLTKDTLKTKKLAGVFDLDQIQVMAALQGKITEEEKLRLQLQLALLQGQTEEAQRLAEKLAQVQGQTGMLSLYLRTLPDAKNPFASWSDYLKAIEEQLKRIATTQPAVAASTAATTTAIAAASSSAIGTTAWIEAQKTLAANKYYGISGTYTGYEIPSNVSMGATEDNVYSAGYTSMPPIAIALNLDGNQIGSVLVDNLQNQTASGVLLSSSRLQPDWNYAV